MKNLLIGVIAIMLLACGQSGEEYDVAYYKNGEEPLVYGNILLVWAQYEVNGNPMFPSNPTDPIALRFDSVSAEENGKIQGVLNTLKVGDSCSFQVDAQNLWEKSFKQPLPDSLEATTQVKVTLSIVDQMETNEYQSYVSKKEQERSAIFFEEERKILDQYIIDNNLDVETSESGLMYVIHETGSGAKPENGQLVNVKYRGTTLNGNEFDAGTYEFPLGRGVVIGGWDEGIGYLNVGSKATLYIPSSLGYGSRGAGGDIPPFSSLIFEVELLGIK